ncbi:hypothetical protein MTO96_051263 [Rhipicephalus appendiculatus]
MTRERLTTKDCLLFRRPCYCNGVGIPACLQFLGRHAWRHVLQVYIDAAGPDATPERKKILLLNALGAEGLDTYYKAADEQTELDANQGTGAGAASDAYQQALYRTHTSHRPKTRSASAPSSGGGCNIQKKQRSSTSWSCDVWPTLVVWAPQPLRWCEINCFTDFKTPT